MKSKTSHMADKKLKSLLFLAAKTTVVHNKSIVYMQNGKSLKVNPYFLIMNNVSNKMLRIVHGVIQSRKPYDMNHICNDQRQLN